LAGGEVAAGESVISAADITWTYSALEGEAGTLAAFRKRLADGIPAETMFSTYLGVRTEPGEVERQTFGTTIFEDPGDITREPATVYLTSAVDPTAAPQGLASLTIHEMADYAHWARLAGPAGPDGLLTGPIGLELAQAHLRLGSRVTVVELMDQIIPGADRDIVAPLVKHI